MRNSLTELPYGLPGQIFRSPLPFSPFFDPEQNLLDAYIDAGVQTVVMLTPEEEAKELTGQDMRKLYQNMGFDLIYAPIPDFSIPAFGALQSPLKQVLQAARAGRTIVIHCHAGLGRTGLLAACLAKVVFDMDGLEALAWVRQYIPDAVETVEQLRLIQDFELIAD